MHQEQEEALICNNVQGHTRFRDFKANISLYKFFTLEFRHMKGKTGIQTRNEDYMYFRNREPVLCQLFPFSQCCKHDKLIATMLY